MENADLQGVKQLDDKASSNPLQGKTHENLIYYICEIEDYPEPVGTLKRNITFRLLEEIDTLAWALARECAPAEYWMLAFLDEKEAKEFKNYKTAQDSSDITIWLPTEFNGEFLIKIPVGNSLHISENSGACHMPGFHLFALPPGSNSNRVFSRILSTPDVFPKAIHNLIWDTEYTLDDSLCEIRPYGDEDRNFICITYTPPISRQRVREVLQTIYNLTLYKKKVSYDEFMSGEFDQEC